MRLRQLFGIAAMAFFVSSAADAAPVPLSYDITFNPADVYFDNQGGSCTGNVGANTVAGFPAGCASLAFTFALTDFDPGTDTLASGSVSFFFYDGVDAGEPGNAREWIDVSLDALLDGDEVQIAAGSQVGNPSTAGPYDVRARLQPDGSLNVLLALGVTNAGTNDFFFASSRLIARGERNEEQVVVAPEPASLALFGVALTAIGMRLRRR